MVFKSQAVSPWVGFSLVMVLVFFGSLSIQAACQIGCATFNAGDVTNIMDKEIKKVVSYQFKNDCIFNCNSNKSDTTKSQDGRVANQWRPVTADVVCKPVKQQIGLLGLVLPGESMNPTNPGAYTDVNCAQQCKKRS